MGRRRSSRRATAWITRNQRESTSSAWIRPTELVMNAGVIGPQSMDVTAGGVTIVFATNVLGHVVSSKDY
jgi:hypothetical protein